jgi:Flp pilus assembly protein TadG
MRAASVAHAGARAARDRPLASGGSDAGSAAAEIVILTPLLVVLALLLVIGGRLASGLQDVGDAARTSVESAVIASTPSAAQAQAATTAGYEISHDGLQCTPYSVTTDVTDFIQGGAVSVQLRCGIELVTLGIPGLPGSVTLSDQATAGIELYREMG